MMATIPATLRPVLAEAIDYAGLFPPSELSMAEAVSNYARYAREEDRWALGRFVVTCARLGECAGAAAPLVGDAPWRLSVLVRGPEECAALPAFNDRWSGSFCVDAAEGRASDAAQVRELVRACPAGIVLFVELPLDDRLDPCVHALRGSGAAAKIRMGGVTADAFPSPERVVHFLRACHAAQVPWKATAGLHHPVRGEYPLTYAPASPRATMHGYLNLMAAAAVIECGADDADAMAWLRLGAKDVRISPGDGLAGGGASLPVGALAAVRRRMAGFGSCSFREPLDDLATLGLA